MKTNLNELLKQKGSTQQEMADYLGISQASFYAYTVDKAEPNIERLIKLADYFGCSVDYLLGHQTQTTLQIEGLTENQKKALELVKTLTDYEAGYIVGAINRLRSAPLDDVVAEVLNERRK